MRTEFIFFAMASSVYASAMSSSWGNGWSANNTAIWYTTITTTAFTTYCPEATVLTHGGVEYTVTAATTLTITDCPCTVTKPMTKTLTPTTILYTSCSTTPTNAPPPPPNPNNSNNPAPPPNPTNNNNPVMTQTVTNQNGGEVTVTNQIATKTNQNGGVATGTGGGAVPSYSQVVGAAAERKVLGWGGMALGMVGGIAFLL